MFVHAQSLPELRLGERVRIQLPGQKTWKVALHSYDVHLGGGTFRQNRYNI